MVTIVKVLTIPRAVQCSLVSKVASLQYWAQVRLLNCTVRQQTDASHVELSHNVCTLVTRQTLIAQHIATSRHIACSAKAVVDFPLAMGGLRLRSVVKLRQAAHWSTWADAIKMIAERHPKLLEPSSELCCGHKVHLSLQLRSSACQLTGCRALIPCLSGCSSCAVSVSPYSSLFALADVAVSLIALATISLRVQLRWCWVVVGCHWRTTNLPRNRRKGQNECLR